MFERIALCGEKAWTGTRVEAVYKEARREGGGLAEGQWGGEDWEGLATFAGDADRAGGLDVGFRTRESRVIPGFLT